MYSIQLIQLPLHPSTGWEPTGNIPLAPAVMAAAAGLSIESVFPESLLNTLGDTALFEELKSRNPELMGVTLYLWNKNRSLNLIRKLKLWNPDLLVVAGGPEVTADNLSLLQETSVDLFVAGEGESFAVDVLSPDKLRSILSTGRKLLGPIAGADLPDHWPDPYETGHLSIETGSAIHLESQRGCSSMCSYCAYRRASPEPRIIPAEGVLKKIKMLSEAGASELVFLDPTFNNRSDLSLLLSGVSRFNLDCFAEIKGDLIWSSETADSFAQAGFSSLEVGLQTMNMEVLHSLGRGGNPFSIIKGASLLKGAGVTPVVDLILGLPGDSPENIESAAVELKNRNIHEQVQTFCLSVLPGTELRSNAESLSIQYDNNPPYTITRSGSWSIQQLLQSRETVSDILGYDADPPSRPVLTDSFPGLELFIPEENNPGTSPSVRHGVLRVNTQDAWLYRNSVLNKVRERREKDPYCPLDIVIQSHKLFPLDLIEMLNDIPDSVCYTRSKAELYGVPGLLRVAVITDKSIDRSWVEECSELALTVIRTREPVSLPGGRVGLLLQGVHDLSALSAMYSQAPHLVFFAEKELELLWNLEVLELG
jgi:radical SAM superfamily enzyme YgiQ (UPF0313 family)